MEGNPFNEEQVKKINELASLPAEEQKSKWPEFLKTLNKEQIEFLKEQQQKQSECLFCSIVKGNIPSRKIYEDDEVLAFLDIRPTGKGHTLVIPKQHHVSLLDIPDELLSKVIIVVKNLSGVVTKAIGATGFNISMNNYPDAGQVVPHAHFHIMPRFKGDGHKPWDAKEANAEELDEVLNSISNLISPSEERAEEPLEETIEKSVDVRDYDEEPLIP